MPRGKYVNHKGRSRHFTSPEELANESSEEETSSSEQEGDDEAAGTSKVARAKPKPRVKKTSGSGGAGGESSDENSDEESSEEEDRDARKGVAALIEIENPNRATKKVTQKLTNLKLDAPKKPELTRREREEIEKQKAAERYQKLHAAGKTTEAKADLARLALVRQQRADAAAKREAEKKALEEKKSSGKA